MERFVLGVGEAYHVKHDDGCVASWACTLHCTVMIQAPATHCYPSLFLWHHPMSTVQVKDFTVRGLASDVDVQLDGIDGAAFDKGALGMPLWFGQVVPGSGWSKRVTVRNTTTLPFPFK